MAVTMVGNEGSLTGTTAVPLIAAPGASTQRSIPKGGASIYNKDTVSHDFTFQKNKGGTITEVQKFSSVAAGETAVLAAIVCLDATNESLEAKSNAAATTTEPTFNAMAVEHS